MSWLRSLTPRDLRAFIALMASIGGTMALTCVAVWIVWILWQGGWAKGTESIRIDKIGLIAVLVIVIMGVTMTSLGLAINRRTLRANIGSSGFEASGGDEPTPSTIAAAAAGAAAGATAGAAAVAPTESQQ
jgi:hypothetical protein